MRTSTKRPARDGIEYPDSKKQPKQRRKERIMEKRLGSDQPMRLVLCDCGGLRLSSGPMTIHFSRDQFQAFASAVGRLASIVAQPMFGQESKPARSNVSEVCH